LFSYLIIKFFIQEKITIKSLREGKILKKVFIYYFFLHEHID